VLLLTLATFRPSSYLFTLSGVCDGLIYGVIDRDEDVLRGLLFGVVSCTALCKLGLCWSLYCTNFVRPLFGLNYSGAFVRSI
jgi:hypothetical protein